MRHNAKQIHDAASAQRSLAHVLVDHGSIWPIERTARERMIEASRRDANERLADLAGTFPVGSHEFTRAAEQASAVGQAHLSYGADIHTLLRWANEWDALAENNSAGQGPDRR